MVGRNSRPHSIASHCQLEPQPEPSRLWNGEGPENESRAGVSDGRRGGDEEPKAGIPR